jgi:hypothetical protein
MLTRPGTGSDASWRPTALCPRPSTPTPVLLVLDDVVGEREAQGSHILQEIFTTGRHLYREASES